VTCPIITLSFPHQGPAEKQREEGERERDIKTEEGEREI
jgi:hypothetical protein